MMTAWTMCGWLARLLLRRRRGCFCCWRWCGPFSLLASSSSSGGGSTSTSTSTSHKSGDDNINGATSWPSASTVALLLAYISTGAAQPTLVDMVRYSGAAGVSATRLPLLLPMLANTAGMAAVGLLALCDTAPPTATAEQQQRELEEESGRPRLCVAGQLMLLVWVDMAASTLILLGLLLVGSGIYVVMYSSTTLWTACIASCAGTATLSRRQWMGVWLLTAGVRMTMTTASTHDCVAATGVLDNCAACSFVGGYSCCSTAGTSSCRHHR
jgi:hypothetical protein